MKTCTSCKENKPETSDFFKKGKRYKGGLMTICRNCIYLYQHKYYLKNRDRCLKLQKLRRKKNKKRVAEVGRKSYLKNRSKILIYNRNRHCEKKYGLTSEKVDELKSSGCSVCGASRQLHIDHCHTTNKVRGVLCINCNTALGNMKEDTLLIDKLKQYIIKTRFKLVENVSKADAE